MRNPGFLGGYSPPNGKFMTAPGSLGEETSTTGTVGAMQRRPASGLPRRPTTELQVQKQHSQSQEQLVSKNLQPQTKPFVSSNFNLSFNNSFNTQYNKTGGVKNPTTNGSSKSEKEASSGKLVLKGLR